MAAGRGAVDKNVFARFRDRKLTLIAVRTALVLISLGCLLSAGRSEPAAAWLQSGIGLALAFFLSAYHLRHWGLAAVVACAPIPGVLFFLAMAHSGDVALATALSLGLGWAAALLIGQVIAFSVVAGDPVEIAPINGLRSNIRLLLATNAVLAVPAFATGQIHIVGNDTLGVAVGGMLALVSSVLIFIVAPALRYGEDFLASTNRLHERWAREFGRLALAVRPRFGASLSGVACVLCAIAIFDGSTLRLAADTMTDRVAVACALVVAASIYAALLDWRRSLAVCASTAMANIAGIWVLAHNGLFPSRPTLAALVAANAICIAFQLFIARDAVANVVTEDDAAAGSERAVETRAAAVCMASAVAVGGPFALVWPTQTEWFCFSGAVVVAAVSAIVFQSAFSITLEVLWPRRATIAARYRVR